MDTAEVWNRFSEEVTRYIRYRINDPETARDLLQEVFVRVHTNLHRVKHEGRVKSWVFTIARNVITDHYRKGNTPVLLPEEDTIADRETEQQELTEKDCLLPLIHNLPEKYRKAMLLSEIEGRKQAEVARILEISLSGAKSRIQRGRRLLQHGYMDCCDYKLNEDGYLVGEHKEDCKVCSQ
ncbi:sigma-70 family RNA polymerase sigma factor [Sinomicrobium kalidii]|uniref:sigma-70 family RNA polymerase sigma factor n=1 Tax=Sinomicrobium kalidii TaxID=2900738 RepID=UPI001E375AC6|nr:sigma-70 family RNA polymerase sigma factor [Sinomicrobium kalidii]UGU14608.1 sigma-70 family RNA polymerase sigma factor [Sinomicrobium kalidii]